ncbi:D-2-hydroxyacid dehydrogenase [Mariniflexile soesokkakense]|uniref:D-2-hydroxyacid dehydrogenase n=1 Tax=Mariniflexile soesokkakense TaxID=1343160 RepID=A0ABV0ACM4_9FLAO
MKMVVLDGYTLNPGDLTWEGLKQYGDLKVHYRTGFNPKTVIETIGDAEVVFTNKVPLPQEVLEQVPNLKYIGVLATGYNVVDVETANKLNILVANVPNYGTAAVAQFTMGLLLEMCHHIGDHNKAVHDGEWTKSLDFCFWNTPLIELAGKNLGIIGFGRIGQATAKIAQAFGLNILANNRSKDYALESDTCRYVELEELFEKSDIISLHCPLFESTEGIINKENINKMKDGVMIINTSRGGLIVEEDLKEALNSGKVAGAAVDVVSSEPIKENNPLLKAKNCIITPHIAWAPKESRIRLMDIVEDNLKAYLDENPKNVVNS